MSDEIREQTVDEQKAIDERAETEKKPEAEAAEVRLVEPQADKAQVTEAAAQPEESVQSEDDEPKGFFGKIAAFFIWIWVQIKTWFYEKIIIKFKGDENHRSFVEWLKDVGRWFKKLPSRIVKFFKALPGWFKTLPQRTVAWAKSLTKENVKAFFLGNGENKGFIQYFVSYTLLIVFGFVYVYPMLYMLGYSLMSASDVANPMVNYLPTALYFNNYSEASQVLNFWGTFFQTVYISVLPALFQTASCCLVAYGLARFNFPGKKVVFALILLTFIVPSQLTMLPQLLIFTNMHLTDSVMAFIVPAAFGQGIKSAVFILVFYQYFKGIPDSVIEAAKIDGANSFQIFVKLGLSTAKPALWLAFLLSVVWYYNETVLSSIYLGGELTTLPLELAKFEATYKALFGDVAVSGKSVNEAIYMAGTLLSILPLLIFYFFTQRHFTEGFDKAGITGE